MMEVLKDWAGPASALIGIGSAVYAVLTARSKQNSAELAVVDSKLDDHGRRIQALESELEHLPGKDMVHQMQLTMKDIQIEMAGMKASAEATARTARRVEEFLLEQGKRTA